MIGFTEKELKLHKKQEEAKKKAAKKQSMRHIEDSMLELPIDQTLLNLSLFSQATYTEETDWLLGRSSP